MKYQIKYSYRTGDSFGNSDEESTLDLEWDNLDIAKENLKAIKEHYQMYEEIDEINSRWKKSKLSREEVFDKYKNNWWFINKKDKWFVKFKDDFCIVDDTPANRIKYKDYESKMEYDSSICQNCMKLKTDKNTFMQQWNPWCGYFETLYGAEIVGVDNDLKFEI